MDEHQSKRFKGEQSEIQDFNGKSEANCAIPEKHIATPLYNKRREEEEIQILSRFFAQGLDQEDIDYLKRAYDELVKRDATESQFLRQVQWVDNSNKVEPDDPKMAMHATGYARTKASTRSTQRTRRAICGKLCRIL